MFAELCLPAWIFATCIKGSVCLLGFFASCIEDPVLQYQRCTYKYVACFECLHTVSQVLLPRLPELQAKLNSNARARSPIAEPAIAKSLQQKQQPINSKPASKRYSVYDLEVRTHDPKVRQKCAAGACCLVDTFGCVHTERAIPCSSARWYQK